MFPPPIDCRRLSRRPEKSLHIFLFVLVFVHFAQTASAQALSDKLKFVEQPQEVITLELGKPIERELTGEQRHGYQITLAAGQYARAVLEQRGIDAVVRLIGEDGNAIIEFDSEWRTQGEEKIELVAAAAGTYRLLVTAKNLKLSAGRYEIRLVEVRDASENDRLLDEARRLLTQTVRLFAVYKYREALSLTTKALELQERVLGAEHPDLAYTLRRLGILDRYLVDRAGAEACFLRGLSIAQKGLGAEHPLVGRLHFNLAANYEQKGDYARAESSYKQSLSIREAALGSEDPEVADSLTSLALLYINMGDYLRPEPLLQRALTIYEKAYGEEHVNFARALNFLGLYYKARGDYVRAEPLLKRTLAYWEKTFAPNNGWVVLGLWNLAELYVSMGDYDRAEPLYLRAISIDEGNNSPNYPKVLQERAELANLYLYRGDYSKAEKLYLSALPALEKALGPSHPLVGFHFSKLAEVYVALNDYAKAEPLYHRSLPIMEEYCGKNCPDIAEVYLGLARMFVVQGKKEQAIGFQVRANAIVEHNLDINLAIGSERQKLAYLVTLPEQISQAVSFHVRYAVDDPAARELAVTAVLQRKGRVQDTLSNSFYSLRNRASAEDQTLWDQLNRVTSRLARLVLNGPQDASAEQHKEINTLEEQREKIESEISRRSAEFRAQKQPITLDAIRRAIPDNAALIEFAIYRPFDPTLPNERMAYGEPHYVVYVLRRQGDVQWKELGEAKAIDEAVTALRQVLGDPQRHDVQQLARSVDERVMQPVRAMVGDAKLLLISPDGQLNLIPLAALVDEQGHYLVERFSFTYLTSGRDLLHMQVARESKSKPLVIANPLFGEPPADLLAKVNATAQPTARGGRRRSITTGKDLSEVYFAPLGGTAQEARSIQMVFPEANLLTGAQATKAALEQAAAPRLLHIATHGFFLQDTQGIAGAKIENPLLRSGLALASANLKNSNGDTGILTALEASGLNLWGTKLVVLSACDTGVGEVRNGDGVYGLRRSFVLAGADSLVMSLWPISDYTTRQLMIGYYRNLKQGLGRGSALRQVQLDMLKRNPKLHPFYWANFIQSGEWANLDGKR